MARILIAEFVEVCSRGLADVLAEHHITCATDDAPVSGFDLVLASTSAPTALRWKAMAGSLGATPVVFLVQDGEWPALKRMVSQANVRGLVHLHSSAQVIRDAVSTVLGGETYFDAACQQLAQQVRKASLEELGATPREIEVLDRILRGRTNATIAREIGCSERTVKFHVSNLLKKADVRSRRELRDSLARLDSRLGLVGVPIA